MKSYVKILAFCAVLAIIFSPTAVFAQQYSGFQLVPCGTSKTSPCTFNDLYLLLVRLINLLLGGSAIIAVYYILLAGWGMMKSMGNPEQLTAAKASLTQAIVGFALILLSFVFISLVLSIFGVKCQWWAPEVWKNSQAFYNLCIL